MRVSGIKGVRVQPTLGHRHRYGSHWVFPENLPYQCLNLVLTSIRGQLVGHLLSLFLLRLNLHIQRFKFSL